MRKLLIISILIITIVPCLYNTGRAENHPFVKEYLKKAKDENKILILEFWSPRCGPCVKLKRDIFDNEEVSNFLNKNFVLLKVSPADSIHNELFKYYKLDTQSSVLFFNKGGALIECSYGYNGNKKDYLDFMSDIAKQKNLYSDIYKEYLKDTTDVHSNYLLAKRLIYRDRFKACEHFKYILKNDNNDVNGYHSVCRFVLAENEYYYTNKIDKLIEYVQDFTDTELGPKAYSYITNSLRNKKDKINCIKMCSEAYNKYPTDPDILNKYAWSIYVFKLKEEYNKALKLVEKAISINPKKAGYMDTQAWLQFETGQIDKAIKSEEKAYELNPHKAYKKALEKFKASKRL
ncbi:MAG: DUF255 domain-containing protein [bacterium]|nr:DUF255 domain-containing protein [bacterium]